MTSISETTVILFLSEESGTHDLSTVNAFEYNQKTITFGNKMSSELVVFVFVAVNIQQGVPFS